MRKALYLLIITTLFTACSSDKSNDTDMYGHWMQKDFYEAIKSKQKLAEINAEKIEFILNPDDSSFAYIKFGQKIISGKAEPYKNKHLVIKNFNNAYGNLDVKLLNNELHLINVNISEETIFIKLDENVYKMQGSNLVNSHSIPYIHHLYISGSYKMDSIEVKFDDQGKIFGLDKFQNFSFCYDSYCSIDGYNTVFLSNKDYEGNYYAFESKGDSLYIYDIDEYAVARGMKSKKNGIKYAMKKIN